MWNGILPHFQSWYVFSLLRCLPFSLKKKSIVLLQIESNQAWNVLGTTVEGMMGRGNANLEPGVHSPCWNKMTWTNYFFPSLDWSRVFDLCTNDVSHKEDEWNERDGIQEHCEQRDGSKNNSQRRELLHQRKHELEGLCQRQNVSQASSKSRSQTFNEANVCSCCIPGKRNLTNEWNAYWIWKEKWHMKHETIQCSVS